MKTKIATNQNTGSALLVTLFLMTILAVSLAGYLSYTQQQTFLGARAQAWNMALSVSEAGVEEGLEQLNNNYSHLTADGWTQDGTTYSINRSLGDGNSYTVYIDYSSTIAPVITARAFINPPRLAQNAPPVFFATAGVNLSAPTNVTRAIQVTTSRGSLFLAAMVARHKIDMNGNYVLTDSFDSSDPAKSTNGHYDVTKAGNRGDVASNDGIVNTVSVGNADIYGKVYTGPGGTAAVGSQGGVGEHSWRGANNGIEPGWFFDNANFTFPDTTLPYKTGIAPPGGDVVTVAGNTTNQQVYNNVSTPPGPLPLGQTLGPVTTNTLSSTSSTYPGTQPGLTTNTTWQTTSIYPGNITGMTTNYIGFVTVSAYPGPQPMLTTNCSSTALRVKDKPAVGTYCGIAPWPGSGNDNNWWFYYPIASYTYANQFSYTYPTYNYGYVSYTYSYVIYTSTPTYTTNHYDHVLANGDYYASDLSGTTLVTGTARLVMPNGLNMSGNDQITIAPGAGLTLYSDGNSATIGGNGILNKGGWAGSFIMYATPTVTSFTFNGNGEFTGILVAPNANLKMNGGGYSVNDFTGALMVNSVMMNGHFNFHYDESLSRLGGNGRFLITSWNEIP